MKCESREMKIQNKIYSTNLKYKAQYLMRKRMKRKKKLLIQFKEEN